MFHLMATYITDDYRVSFIEIAFVCSHQYVTTSSDSLHLFLLDTALTGKQELFRARLFI